LWVSTPTVTRAGSRCAMVVSPSFLLGRVVGPAGRADNTATSLVATCSYQVTPLRSVLFAAAVASSRQVLRQAPGRWGQGSDPRHDHARDKHGGHGRPTRPKPGITPVAYRVRSHRDHRRNHRSGARSLDEKQGGVADRLASQPRRLRHLAADPCEPAAGGSIVRRCCCRNSCRGGRLPRRDD
jgi:hypothetical protein